MKKLLFITFLKPGMLSAYKKFGTEITGPRKAEYKELLKRYGLKTAEVRHGHIAGRDYVIIMHDAQADALERLKQWGASTHPFDLWFGEQLGRCYEHFPEPTELLFKCDA